MIFKLIKMETFIQMDQGWLVYQVINVSQLLY